MSWRSRGGRGPFELKLLIIAGRPVPAPFHGTPPLRLESVGPVSGDGGFEIPVQLPEAGDVGVSPGAGTKAGQKRCAQRGRLRLARPADRDPDQVGLELAQDVHDRGAPVDAQLCDWAAGVT